MVPTQVRQKRLRKQRLQSDPVRVFVIEKGNAAPSFFQCGMKSPAVIALSFTLDCWPSCERSTVFIGTPVLNLSFVMVLLERPKYNKRKDKSRV